MVYDTFLFRCSGRLLSIFMPELQRGFYITSNEGKSIYSFLTDTCRMSESYISQKVKTVLLNGGPVDDIFNTGIKEGDTIAVSGAMPGIVGAMMRMGSPYAAMRDSITVRPGEALSQGKEIVVLLKLFNVILSDMGPGFLEEGILLEREMLAGLFKEHGNEIDAGCSELLLNDSPADRHVLTGEISGGISGLVFFKIEIEHEGDSKIIR